MHSTPGSDPYLAETPANPDTVSLPDSTSTAGADAVPSTPCEAVTAGCGTNTTPETNALETNLEQGTATEGAVGGSNFTASGDKFGEYAGRASPEPGYHDVAVHGSETDFGATPDAWKNGENFDHRQLAKMLENDPSYVGGDIRLVSCNAGACNATAAQNLADKMGVNVLAPSDTVWAWPNGDLTIGPDQFTSNGRWVPFSPGGR